MKVPEITVQEAQVRLGSAQPPRLIDVREEDEWALCHLPCAELVPLSQLAELATEKFADPQEALLIYCHHGSRSAHVTEYLLQQGYRDVTNLGGGIDAWSREIDPTVARY